ncbi:hypothetical protein [Gulosibacter sp. 10]|uniref:hypothetical protein n=1 Tax=Gulosibacter sp. 10 TaxID=1255570 RepID=UPI0011245664|nr:hypothetical protein [Gulosibacter sp. 10]
MTAALAVGVVCFALAWSELGPWQPVAVWPAVLALLAFAGLAAGAPMFSRFAEAWIDSEAVVIRRVLGPRRAVPLSGIEEVVLLRSLRLPSRTGASSAPRVVLRGEGRTIAAFSPRSADLVPELGRRGLVLAVVDDPLTPFAAARRYPKSVGFAELLVQPFAWGAIVFPILIIVWVVCDAASG